MFGASASDPGALSAPDTSPVQVAVHELLKLTAGGPQKRRTPPVDAAGPAWKRVASARPDVPNLTTSFSPDHIPLSPSSFPQSAPPRLPPRILPGMPQTASPIANLPPGVPRPAAPALGPGSVPGPKRRGRPPRSSASSRSFTPGPYPTLAPHPAPQTSTSLVPGLRPIQPASGPQLLDVADPGTPSAPSAYGVYSMPPHPPRKRGRPPSAAVSARACPVSRPAQVQRS